MTLVLERAAKAAPTIDAVNAGRQLLAYCRSEHWAGYDPYDALNSQWLTSLPVLDRRLPRLVLTQALKRSPINIRPLLRIPPTQNPKGLALFLAAVLRAPALCDGIEDDLAGELINRLIALRSPHSAYWCWG
jgi:hypothetical protein